MGAFVRLLGLLLSLVGAEAVAGLQLSATRVIYHEGSRERTLQLLNTSDYPVLVQSWVDDGASNAAPERHLSPIIALPAVFRLEPGAVQSLRLMYNNAPLPKDRESLFWLNLLEIPPAGAEAANRLTMTLQTQLKVLYRPGELAVPVDEAPQRQDFRLRREAGTLRLAWRNPTPYSISLGGLELMLPGSELQLGGATLGPYAERLLELPRQLGTEGRASDTVGLVYQSIDDRGMPQTVRRELAWPETQ